MREGMPVNCRAEFRKFFSGRCHVTPCGAGVPTRSGDKRLRKYANLAAVVPLLEFELCSYVAFGLLKSDK